MSNTSPLVSIIIPTYNRAHLITQTLDSIKNQTYSNWECLIVDDGSSDNTQEVIEEYKSGDPRFKYFLRPDNHSAGGNGARNFGFTVSKGEYINFFDSDDLMDHEKLAIQIQKLQESQIDMVICQTEIFEEDMKTSLGLRCDDLSSDNYFQDFVTKRIIFLTQAPLIARHFLTSNKLVFDEELKAAQEWEFFCRALLALPRIKLIDNVLVKLREHKDSISHDKDNKHRRNWNYTLARIKVYKMTKNKNKLSDYLTNYFQEYFEQKYFYFCSIGKFDKAQFLSKMVFQDLYPLRVYLKSLLYIFSMQFLKKGVRFKSSIFN